MQDSDTVPPSIRSFTGKELTLKDEWHPLSGIFLLWWALASAVSWVLGPFTFSVLIFRVSGFIETSMPTLVYGSDTGTSVLLMMIWGVLVGVVFGITFGIYNSQTKSSAPSPRI